MTNSEAIKIIKQVEFDDADDNLITAIEMAIEALEKVDNSFLLEHLQPRISQKWL